MKQACASATSERATHGLRLPAPVAAGLVRATQLAWPREACGLLIGVRVGHELRATAQLDGPNRAGGEAGRRRFQLDPVSWLRAERQASASEASVLCVWHSHPGGSSKPSAEDWAGEPGFGWHVLVAVPVVGPPSLWAWRRAARTGTPVAVPIRP